MCRRDARRVAAHDVTFAVDARSFVKFHLISCKPKVPRGLEVLIERMSWGR